VLPRFEPCPILDVRALDDPGRQFLVEMQRLVRAGFLKRLLYYWSSGHAEQLFKGERYEMLQPTYIVCLVNETLFADAVYHHCFRVYDDQHGVLLCKDLEIHVVELCKFDVAAAAVQTPLERWCYFFKHGASLDPAKLPATLDVPMIRKAVEILVKLSQDEIERHRAAERLRIQRDATDLVASARDARQIGREEGREEGWQQGIERGKRIGRIQGLQQQLEQAETSDAELSRLPEPDLVQLEDSLKRQLQSKKQANGTPPTDKT
jgi:predicted transposase/invertase (TIGR01784 family)